MLKAVRVQVQNLHRDNKTAGINAVALEARHSMSCSGNSIPQSIMMLSAWCAARSMHQRFSMHLQPVAAAGTQSGQRWAGHTQ